MAWVDSQIHGAGPWRPKLLGARYQNLFTYEARVRVLRRMDRILDVPLDMGGSNTHAYDVLVAGPAFATRSD